jgi:carbonic anhydrase
MMYTQSKETQQQLTPQKALEILKSGNERFVNNLRVQRNLLSQKNETSTGQYPFAAILSCMDSRTSAELIFDQGLGDIFSIRIAGNVLNEDILGSMEYAMKVAGSKIILVLGHTKCGAILGACDNVQMGNLTGLLDKIRPAIEQETETQSDRNGKNEAFVTRVTKLNVIHTMDEIRENSPIIAGMEKEGEIMIVGGLYDLESGLVEFFG